MPVSVADSGTPPPRLLGALLNNIIFARRAAATPPCPAAPWPSNSHHSSSASPIVPHSLASQAHCHTPRHAAALARQASPVPSESGGYHWNWNWTKPCVCSCTCSRIHEQPATLVGIRPFAGWKAHQRSGVAAWVAIACRRFASKDDRRPFPVHYDWMTGRSVTITTCRLVFR
ncbi:hypothetical protein K439DRAFT_1077481 [Ramaria rubella]|nr:hypothetical protein K439DRAFT_1077481 [Ramaria rubella]